MADVERPRLKVGFIPIIDCAAIVLAAELGAYERHGLEVEIRREVSWANVRDKLALGALDASHILSVELDDGDVTVELPVKRGGMTVHDEMIIHGSGGNRSPNRWRRTYITAFRTKGCVDYERSIGFTHSHNDKVNWQTHLGALGLRET